MSCLTKLKTDGLNGQGVSGGTWYYKGALQITVDITGYPSTTLNPDDMVPGGDDPEIDISTIVGLTPGGYTDLFEYHEPNAANCEPSTVSLTLYTEACAGQSPTPDPEVCKGGAEINLYDLVENCANGDTPSTNGNWSVIVGDTTGFNLTADNNGTNDTFDPSAPGVVAETKTIRYTVPDPAGGTAGAGCTSCGEKTVDIDLVVNESFNAGTTGNIVGCIAI